MSPRARPTPWGPLLFSIAFSGLFTWLFVRALDLEAFGAAFRRLRPGALGLYFGITVAMIGARAVRSAAILSRLCGARRSFGRLLSTSLVGFGAILLFPFRSGELVRPWLLASPRHLSGERVRFSSLIGVSIVERVLDGLLISLLLLGAVLQHHLAAGGPSWVVPALAATTVLFLGGTLVLVFAITHPAATLRFARRVTLLDSLSRRFTTFKRLDLRFESLFKGTVQGFQTVAKIRPILLFLVLSALYWGLNALSLWVLARAFALSLPFMGAVVVMGFIVIGIFIPSLPAHIGNFHQFALMGLALFLPSGLLAGDGKAMIVALHGFQLLTYLALALSGIAAGGLSRAKD